MITKRFWDQDLPQQWDLPLRRMLPTTFEIVGDNMFTDTGWEYDLDYLITKIASCPQHTFTLVVSNPKQLWDYINNGLRATYIHKSIQQIKMDGLIDHDTQVKADLAVTEECVLPPNLHIGVEVNTQAQANELVPLLLQIQAHKRFISCNALQEPLKLDDFAVLGQDLLPTKEGTYKKDYQFWINALKGELTWVSFIDDECPFPKLDYVTINADKASSIHDVLNLQLHCQKYNVPCITV